MKRTPRIVHFTNVHRAIDVRIFEKECRTLASAGYDVTLVVPHARDEEKTGVHIVGVRPPENRINRLTRTAWEVYRAARELKADLYHFHDPELLPLGLFLQWKSGSPVVFDCHEYTALDILDKDWLRPFQRPVSKAYDWIEQSISRRLAGVVTIGAHMAKQFQPLNREVAVVGNYPYRSLAENPPAVTPEPFRILYLGAIGAVRGYELLIHAMQRLRQTIPQASCSVLGRLEPAGVSSEYLRLSPAELCAQGVEFLPTVPYQQVAAEIMRHRIGWLPWRYVPNHQFCVPTKLLEYMAFGLPVVASAFDEVSRIVRENDCGILVPWDDPEAHAAALQRLFNQPEEARRLGANGRRAILNSLNWETQAVSLLNFYERLLTKWAFPRNGDTSPLSQ